MPVVYLCLIVLAFVGARFHLPLVNLPVVLGVLLLCIDVVIQAARVLLKYTHFSTLLSAVALLFLGTAYLVLWSHWPGMRFLSWALLVVTVGYFVYWVAAKRRITFRYGVTAFLFIVVLIMAILPDSTRMCLKNNIDSEHPDAPLAMRHTLAWYHYMEGNVPTAKRLLEEERDYVNRRLRNKLNRRTRYREAFERDSVVIGNALEELNNGNWNRFEPLVPHHY